MNDQERHAEEQRAREVSDRELLVRIDERVRMIDRRLETHLTRHWTVTLVAIGALLTGTTSLILVLLKL